MKNKMFVIQMDDDSQKLVVQSLEEAQQIIFGDDIQASEDEAKYTFQIAEFTDKEIKELGEFDGF